MKLVDFLDQSGWTRADVARKLGLTRGALTGWDEIPEKWAWQLEGVLEEDEPAPKIVRKCHPRDLPDDELKVIIRTRSQKSDWDICQENGWRVWEFNEAIAGWVKRNPWRGM